jgi:hypothetical protein
MMYADWMDQTVEDGASIVGLIETVRQMPRIPVVEQMYEPTAAPKDEPQVAENPTGTKPGGTGKEAPGQGSEPSTPKGGLSQNDRISLGNELERIGVDTLGVFNNSGPATAGVLRGGEVPTGALEGASASAAVIQSGGTNLNISGTGTVSRRDVGNGRGLESFGNLSAAAPASSGSASRTPAGPRTAVVTSPAVSVGTLSNPQRTVSGLSGSFRVCYNHGLQSNPEMSGSVMVVASVGANGEVKSASVSSSGSISGQVAACIGDVVRRAQFDAPAGGVAVVQIPVKLITQK